MCHPGLCYTWLSAWFGGHSEGMKECGSQTLQAAPHSSLQGHGHAGGKGSKLRSFAAVWCVLGWLCRQLPKVTQLFVWCSASSCLRGVVLLPCAHVFRCMLCLLGHHSLPAVRDVCRVCWTHSSCYTACCLLCWHSVSAAGHKTQLKGRSHSVL
jgi:hypothetical protein